jgi:hypothetical protein
MASENELAVVYAALLLHDDDVEITVRTELWKLSICVGIF